MLGIGLHAYGFMDAAFKWLMLFIASQVCLLMVGLLLRVWRSYRTRASAPVTAATPGRSSGKTETSPAAAGA